LYFADIKISAQVQVHTGYILSFSSWSLVLFHI
jgi:hypothetical protein